MRFRPPSFGWRPDLPDMRDYGPFDEAVLDQFAELPRLGSLASRVDWREYLEEVEPQQLNSSTAHACLAALEYFEGRAIGRRLDVSPAFVYAMARRLEGAAGDNGASLRATLKSIVRFGTPPERFWPYGVECFDQEPTAFLCGYAREYCSLTYLRLDQADLGVDQVLQTIQAFLAAGFPIVFGFSVYASISDQPDIVLPGPVDALLGGQAVVAIGFDDNRRIRSDKGALLIRNSWGSQWGDGGCGWLPYAYVRKGLARDFWTGFKSEWLASGEFRRPELPVAAR